MPRYVDGFVIPIPKKKLPLYRRIAKKACAIWLEHGALEYRECVSEDAACPFGIPFPKLAQVKKSETVVFAWVVYKSRKDRDRINAKIMKDERIMKLMDPKKPPFDCARMAYGGFEVIVEG